MKNGFNKINTADYAEKLRKEFYNNPELWYKVIIPSKVAQELRVKYQDDYSLIWHEHCSHCYSNIDKDTGTCYLSNDETTWLCKDCYESGIYDLDE